MAAATVNEPVYTDYWGRSPIEIVDLTWGNGDTWVSGMGSIKACHFEPATSAAHGITFSGATVTLASGGALTGKLTVIGNGE